MTLELWSKLITRFAPARHGPPIDYVREQQRMSEQLDDQRQRLQRLRAEVLLIRHDVELLKQLEDE
jgi:hypothetical protein